MMKRHEQKSGRITVFPLLVTATVALIIARIGRFVFARQMFDWETRTVQAFGINVEAYRITCGLLAFAVLIGAYIRFRRKRRQEEAGKFVLPEGKT